MSNFGINVAPGIAIKSLDEVEGAAQKMQDKDGQVALVPFSSCAGQTVLLGQDMSAGFSNLCRVSTAEA